MTQNTGEQSRATIGAVWGTLSSAISEAGTGARRQLNRLYASDAIVIAITLTVALTVGASVTSTAIATLTFGAGVGMALSVVLSNSSNPLVGLLGGMVTVGAALVALAPLTLTVAFVFGDSGSGMIAGVTVLWLVLASFAAVTVPTRAPGDGTVRTAGRTAILAGLGILLVVALRLVPETGVREQALVAAIDAVGFGIDLIVRPGGGDALVSLLVLVAVTALIVRWGLGKLPVERFLPPERRKSVVSGLERGRSLLHRLFQLSVLSTLVAVGVTLLSSEAIENGPEQAYTHVETIRTELPAPAGEHLTEFVLAPLPRWILLTACAMGLAIGLIDLVRSALRRGMAGVLANIVAPIIGGAVVTVIIATRIADPELTTTLVSVVPPSVPESVISLVIESPAFVAAGIGLLVALAVLWSAFAFITVLRMVRILPGRATGVALASIALFGTAITAALVSQPTLAVGTAVAALLVWDIGEFGTGLREELPAGTPTFRVEIVHAGTSGLAGLAVGAGALFAHDRVSAHLTPPDPQLALVALAVTAVVTALVTFSLRG